LNIENRKILVLGGYGLVGMAVCRELLLRKPREIQIHSLRLEESEKAAAELAPEAGETTLTVSSGNLFGLRSGGSKRDVIEAELGPLRDDDLGKFVLYDVLTRSQADGVVDCVNTATGIAYGNIFRSASEVFGQLDDAAISPAAAETLLDSLYMPRLIRHVQVMYRGMVDAGTRVYLKVGTTGTGGMGLNIPYTHSEERPSRVLLSKSALAGAQSMLLFLMSRTPGAPITKEIKPAAAIAWKKVGYGPVSRGGKLLHKVEAKPIPLGSTFSTEDPSAATVLAEPYENVFVDTGENGVFSLEEFALVSNHEQMEFVTPEEIGRYVVFEIEGRTTGYDIVNAIDGAVLGPTYRAGLLRHWALEQMLALEKEHGVHSVAFEMLGPPRNSKLLFEAHLFRLAYPNMRAVADTTPEAARDTLNGLVRQNPEVGSSIISIGIPVLFDSGDILRGVHVLVPADATAQPVTPEDLEAWVRDGWVDLRLANVTRWVERFRQILAQTAALPAGDTSSRFVRNRAFWHKFDVIQPGKVVAWVLSDEEGGWRMKR
jgi:NAD(P)-dependent dehydrogenase (short-subunit alcohol dehydrogenase family)